MISVINRYDKYQNSYKSQVLAQEASSGYYTSSWEQRDEWYTPANIIELVLQVLQEIDLDPCAEGNKKIPARLHYTVASDGLQHEWYGRLFINPPLSHPEKWIAKLQSEVLSGRVTEAIALLPAATDSHWLNTVLKTQPICFWKERIRFLDANYQPNLPATQSYCLVYWGNNQQRFREVFSEHGIVYIPVWNFTENNSLLHEEVELCSLTSSTSEKAPAEAELQTVLPVNSTSSTLSTVEPESQTVLPVNSTSSTLSTVEPESQTVLPVNSTSSTLLTVEAESPTVLPVNSTSSTLSTVEAESPTVLPVNSTSSTLSTVEAESPTVLPVNSTSSTKRRSRGKGTGRIHWRTVTKRNGKQYQQAWYDWELNTGRKTISKSTYIPKHLFSIILELEINKAPVNEILSMLGIVF